MIENGSNIAHVKNMWRDRRKVKNHLATHIQTRLLPGGHTEALYEQIPDNVRTGRIGLDRPTNVYVFGDSLNKAEGEHASHNLGTSTAHHLGRTLLHTDGSPVHTADMSVVGSTIQDFVKLTKKNPHIKDVLAHNPNRVVAYVSFNGNEYRGLFSKFMNVDKFKSVIDNPLQPQIITAWIKEKLIKRKIKKGGRQLVKFFKQVDKERKIFNPKAEFALIMATIPNISASESIELVELPQEPTILSTIVKKSESAIQKVRTSFTKEKVKSSTQKYVKELQKQIVPIKDEALNHTLAKYVVDTITDITAKTIRYAARTCKFPILSVKLHHPTNKFHKNGHFTPEGQIDIARLAAEKFDGSKNS